MPTSANRPALEAADELLSVASRGTSDLKSTTDVLFGVFAIDDALEFNRLDADQLGKLKDKIGKLTTYRGYFESTLECFDIGGFDLQKISAKIDERINQLSTANGEGERTN